MKGMFIQTDGPTLGALQAIKSARLTGEVLVAGFDGVPEFVPLLQSGELIVSGMQQPYLMGQESARAMLAHLGGKTPEKEILVPIKIVTSKNIEQELPVIKETVFANEM
jgi:ABC-type sugar transport system substrate-binding protein